MFKKANALNSNAAHFQRKAEAGNSDVKASNTTDAGSKVKTLEQRSRKASKRAASQRDQEVDQEVVLYEVPWLADPLRLPPAHLPFPLFPSPDPLAR
jgi:hypothetical protein